MRSHTDDDGGDAGGMLEGGSGTLEVTARDDLSGVASIELLIDGQRLRPEHLVPVSGCPFACPTTAGATFTVDQADLSEGDHTVHVVVRDRLGGTPQTDVRHAATTQPFGLYSDGVTIRTDPSADTPDEEGQGTSDETPAAICDDDPDFPEPGDESCLPDETSDAVAAVRAEGQAASTEKSPLLVGGGSAPADGASARASATSACPLHEPITRNTSVAKGRRFGLSDQTGFGDLRDRGGPDTFADVRARALDVQRVRIVVPFDLIPRALAQSSASNLPCKEYQGAYSWIKAAVEADPEREPLVSFQKRRSKGGETLLPDPKTKYRAAVKAFMDQFPAVRLYTAWNEPNYKQPTQGTNPDLHESHAWFAGRYWRHLNQLCERGKRCVVAAGDFVDNASLHVRYRSQYFKGMGSPKKVAVWAYHPYGAIKYGANSSAGRRFTRFAEADLTHGAEIWLTEGGTDLRRLDGDSATKLAKQRDDLDRFLNSSSGQFNHPKVKRFYYYEWYGQRSGDSGLVGQGGQPAGEPRSAAPQRPVYCLLRSRTNPSAPPC